MYHDEFASKPAKPVPFGEDALPAITLEVGGGLSLGLAASLNQPLSTLLYLVGGLLPLLTCCFAIAAHRCAEVLERLSPLFEAGRRPSVPVPIPHLFASRASMAGRHRVHPKARSAR